MSVAGSVRGVQTPQHFNSQGLNSEIRVVEGHGKDGEWSRQVAWSLGLTGVPPCSRPWGHRLSRHGAESHHALASRPRGGSDGCSRRFSFFPDGVRGGHPVRSTHPRWLFAKREALQTPAIAVERNRGCGCPERLRRGELIRWSGRPVGAGTELIHEKSCENNQGPEAPASAS